MGTAGQRAILIGLLITGCVANDEAPPADLSVQRQIENGVLVSAASPAIRIRVDSTLSYVGGQRFVLRENVDAEQHFFVRADEAGLVQALFWFQFEELLPHADGTYEYPASDSIHLGDLPFQISVRSYDQEPVPDSDRGAAYRFLKASGNDVPTPALRARFVHIPVSDRRTELMIVYLEPRIAAATEADQSALVDRASGLLSIVSPQS